MDMIESVKTGRFKSLVVTTAVREYRICMVKNREFLIEKINEELTKRLPVINRINYRLKSVKSFIVNK